MLAFVSFTVALPGVGCAQSAWQVQVRDLLTDQGIPNVVVEGRTSRVAGSTDAQGFVELEVTGDHDHESVIVHGADGYGYQAGYYPLYMPRVVYLVPDTALHATPLIPVTGTGAPIVFQGTTWTPFGQNAYTIEVEVPPDVLPEPASFRIAPVPVYASPLPDGCDALINGAVAQFTVDLRNAEGRPLTDVLPEPGIIVRCSPMWYTYAQMASAQSPAQGVPYRLTKTSASWAPQPDATSWDPASGMFTAHLRACSWWLLWFSPLLLSGDTHNGSGGIDPQVPPPAPEITIERDACVTSGLYDSGLVTCGVLQMPVTCTIANSGTTSFNALFQAGLTAELGV
ncbi:MAG TPA: hypothetical protein ENI87_03345, partial [bacterium]|nr:hypothetical protein [bacterium]